MSIFAPSGRRASVELSVECWDIQPDSVLDQD